MKNIVKSLVVTGLFSAMTAQAQTPFVPNYGDDPASCQRNLSLYRSDYEQKNYDAAIINWRKVWNNCPLSSPNLANHGIAMYQSFVDKASDQNKKNALLDTLMQVYERGMVLRPQTKGIYMVSMAQDIMRFADTPENQPKLLKILEETMIAAKESATAATYANYMRIILSENTAGKLSDEELLDNYTKVSDFINESIKRTNNEDMAKTRDMIDDAFANSSAASCENLLRIYGGKYDANKNDAEFLRKLTRMLNRKECTDSELFEKASEQQYALSPSPDAAYNMARLFIRKGNFSKAVEYFEYAINGENESFQKAYYNYQLATIMLAQYKRYTDAKKYALEAIRLRPDWGRPYILLANTYANGPKCGDDDFEQRYVYWVVVDKLQKAKAVDPDVANEVDSSIRLYSQNFPKKEEGFFRGINEGDNVPVGCWINETTRARFPN